MDVFPYQPLPKAYLSRFKDNSTCVFVHSPEPKMFGNASVM